MKKRLLITSIVMMLVVAVALSTATYAWFTSNATVTANSINMTAATSEAPSLGISWVDGNYGTTITATGPVDSFSPAAPATLTKNTTLSTVGFTTALATPTNGGDMVFLTAGAATTPYTWTDGTYESFFLKNLSPANSIGTITMTVTITGDASSLLRVGVFKKDTTNYKLLEVLSNQDATGYNAVAENTTMGAGPYYKLYLGKYIQAVAATDDNVEGTEGEAAQVTAKTADYYAGMSAPAGKFFTATGAAANATAVYGSIGANASVNAMATYTCATSVVVAEDLAAGATIELVVLVWEDGAALGDAEQGDVASVQLNFAAAAPSV